MMVSNIVCWGPWWGFDLDGRGVWLMEDGRMEFTDVLTNDFVGTLPVKPPLPSHGQDPKLLVPAIRNMVTEYFESHDIEEGVAC